MGLQRTILRICIDAIGRPLSDVEGKIANEVWKAMRELGLR